MSCPVGWYRSSDSPGSPSKASLRRQVDFWRQDDTSLKSLHCLGFGHEHMRLLSLLPRQEGVTSMSPLASYGTNVTFLGEEQG